jgi:hypothetical protein
MMSTRRKQLSVDLYLEQYTRLAQDAKTANVTVSNYVRLRLGFPIEEATRRQMQRATSISDRGEESRTA